MRSWTRRVAAYATPILLASFAVASPSVAAPAAVPAPHVSKLAPTSGPTAGGTRVSLIGTGFTHVSKVLFGSRAGSSIRVASSTHLSVVSPAHSAGAQTVQVVTNHGSSTTHTRPFTFVAPPAIRSVSTVRAGATVTVSGTGFLHVTGVTFSGDPGADPHVISPTSLSVVAPAFASGIKTTYVVVHAKYGDSPTHAAQVVPSGSGGAPTAPAPTDVVATTTYQSVTLSWKSDWHVTIEREPGGYQVDCGTNMRHSCTDSYLVRPSTRYTYELRNDGGFGYAQSEPATVTVTTEPLPPAPPPVASAQIYPSSGSTVRVDWQTDADLAYRGVEVRRAVGSVPPATASDGAEVTRSTDANGTYVDSGLTPSTQYSYSVFAFGTHAYAAAVSRTVTTPDAYGGWGPKTLVDGGHGQADSISCPSPVFCVAVDGRGFASMFNGTSWARPQPVDYGQTLTSVSCTSPTFCIAVDRASGVVEFNGTSWGARTVFATGSEDDYAQGGYVSCVDPSFCLAIGPGGQATFDGSAWHPTSTFGNRDSVITGLSCASNDFCVAVTTNAALVDESGTVVRQDLNPPPSGNQSFPNYVNAVSCPAVGMCFAADYSTDIFSLSDGRWSETDEVGDDDGYYPGYQPWRQMLSCASATNCVLVDGSSAAEFDGQTWTDTYHLVSEYDAIGGVSCGAAGECVVIEFGSASVVERHDAWQTRIAFEPPAFGRVAVSCPTSSNCVAVDRFGDYFTYDGSTWSGPRATGWETPPGSVQYGIVDVSCAAINYCILVTVEGTAMMFNGVSWSSPVQVTNDGRELDSVSCPQIGWCMAAGSGASYVFDGVSWGAPTHIGSTAGRVSCASSTLCAAINPGSVFTFDGSSWRDSIDTSNAFVTDVGCSSTTYCVAVTRTSVELVYDGSSWTSKTVAGFDLTYDSVVQSGNTVSCTTGDTCFASTGRYLFRLTPDGATGFADNDDSVQVDPTLACLSPQHCVQFGTGYASDFRP